MTDTSTVTVIGKGEICENCQRSKECCKNGQQLLQAPRVGLKVDCGEFKVVGVSPRASKGNGVYDITMLRNDAHISKMEYPRHFWVHQPLPKPGDDICDVLVVESYTTENEMLQIKLRSSLSGLLFNQQYHKLDQSYYWRYHC